MRRWAYAESIEIWEVSLALWDHLHIACSRVSCQSFSQASLQIPWYISLLSIIWVHGDFKETCLLCLDCVASCTLGDARWLPVHWEMQDVTVKAVRGHKS